MNVSVPAPRAVAMLKSVRTPALALLFAASLPLAGCHSTPKTAAAAERERREQIDTARQDLSQIPPPSKALFLNVGSLDQWQNPWLTVQEKMITLHVLMPDANTSDLGKGTMLRPEAARRQVLNIDPVDLAAALNAVPHEAWPYGRVVAIEEAHDAPREARPQLRRNIEKAIDTLQNIGIVADEWNDGKPLGVR
jgi:hypothetical protein